jgi:hypothetical protein
MAVLAIVAVGCGGRSGGQKLTVAATPVSLRTSAEATLSKGTAKIAFEMTVPGASPEIVAHGTGAMDPASKRFQLDIDVSDLARQMGSTESLPPEAILFSEVVDGTVLYMHNPATAMFGNGKPWIRMDLGEFGDVFDYENGGSFGADPASFLQFVEGAGKVAEMGNEDVRGGPTTHLSGTYTLKDALAAVPDDHRGRVEQSFQGLGLPTSDDEQPIPFDVWIGDDGLVRRVRSVFDPATLAPENEPHTGKVSVTIEYYDFGQPVEIAVPNAAEVSDSPAKFPTSTSSTAN